MIAMSKGKGQGYFNGAIVVPRVTRYIEVAKEYDQLSQAIVSLETSAKLRSFRRRQKGRPDVDAKLEQARRSFAAVKAEYDACGSELATIIYQIANGYADRFSTNLRQRSDFDDLIQDGVLNALKATRKYEVGRGSSLFSFWTRCIRNAWLPVFRKDETRASTLQRYARDVLGWNEGDETSQGRKRWHSSEEEYNGDRIYGD